MKEIEIGKQAAPFCLPDADEENVCLNHYSGKWIVLYFYPKDNTSGCTLEAINFTKEIQKFRNLGSEVIGISPDSPKSHCAFRDKHDLKVTLLSDPDQLVLKQYGVWVLKKMYGKEYYGVERCTFLIDPEGVVAAVWRKVKVEGHIQEVMEKLISLKQTA